VIDKILHPLLSLSGWEAYALVGVLVFAEAAIMLGFVFPGETAAILGGVLAAKGGVTLAGIIITFVGEHWGPKILRFGPLRKRQKGINTALDQLSKRGAVAVFVARFSAFLRAVVPGLAGLSSMPYRIFLPANAIGGICWTFLYVLLGYFVGVRVEKATGIASDVVLGIVLVLIVVAIVRHIRKDKEQIEGSADEPSGGQSAPN